MDDKGAEMAKHTIRPKLPTPIRTYAMIHLAYYMRLRPVEINRIKISDIDFNKKELTLQNRMGNNTRILPMPEKTIKAIAAYLLTRSNKSQYRNLFLSLKSPHKPISPRTVTRYILKAIKQSGLLAPSYSPGHAPELGRKKGAPGLKTLINNLFVRIGLTDKMIKILEQDIRDYRHWIESTPYRENSITNPCPMEVSDFLSFIRNKELAKKKLLAPDRSEQPRINGKSDQPSKNRKQPIRLPDIYEQYLLYHKQSLQISDHNARNVRRVLSIFHDYLKKHHIVLSTLKIEYLDAFMGEFEVALTTRRLYRSFLRGFLKYLYHEEEIIKRDLAPLLTGPPMFAESIPPKFLRPGEIKKLFASLKLETPSDIRAYAIVNLTYTLGLRPSEITRITLDDISFRKGVLTLRDRKAHNPIILPVPENTLKAVAAYVIRARPTSPNRYVFLTCDPPYRPVSTSTVTLCLSRIMKKAGLPSSAYWLRHTYAQNLLETGQSIFVIKEMLGHQSIQSSHRYIHIHTELMRKVLFNETL